MGQRSLIYNENDQECPPTVAKQMDGHVAGSSGEHHFYVSFR